MSGVVRCPHPGCRWNFVGTDQKAEPFLKAHLALMHGVKPKVKA